MSQPVTATQGIVHSSPVQWDSLTRIAKAFQVELPKGDFGGGSKKCMKAIVLDFKKTGSLDKVTACQASDLAVLHDPSQRNILMRSIKEASSQLTAFLIEKKIGLLEVDKDGNTPLHFACQKGDLASIDRLGTLFINSKNNNKETPFHKAIKAGQVNVVEHLLAKFNPPDLLIPLEEDGLLLNPLFLTIKYGHVACTEVLLSSENVAKELPTLGTLFHAAVFFRQTDVLESLLYSEKLVRCLQSKKVSLRDLITRKNPAKGQTALSLAAELGETIALFLIYEKEESLHLTPQERSLDNPEHQKLTPVCHAIQTGQLEALQLLLALGASIEPIDTHHPSPLAIAERLKATPKGEAIYNVVNNAVLHLPETKLELHRRLPENGAWRGGGPKGLAFVGAIKALQTLGILDRIKRWVGSSAGAITAQLLAIGNNAEELDKILKDTDLLSFLDPLGDKKSFEELLQEKPKNLGEGVRALWEFVRSLRTLKQIFLDPGGTIKALCGFQGICKGEKFLDWNKNRIEEKTGNRLFTLGDLRKAIANGERNKQGQSYKHLTVYATMLDGPPRPSNIVKFSSEDELCDDYIVAHIIRMSMSIPGVFLPHVIYIRGPNNEELPQPHLGRFTDGGMLYNLPVETFDARKYLSREDFDQRPDSYVINKRTIGFDLFSAFATLEKISPDETLLGLLKAIMGIYSNAETSLRNLNPSASTRLVKIDIGDVGTLSFNLSPEQKAKLIKSGFEATMTFFDRPFYSSQGPLNPLALFKAHKRYLGLPAAPPPVKLEKKESLFADLLAQYSAQDRKLAVKSSAVLLHPIGDFPILELVIEFGYRNLQHFSMIKWIDCTTQASLIQGYQELAEFFNCPFDPETFITDINARLEQGTLLEKGQRKPWLLIFANVNRNGFDLTKLTLPRKGGGILAVSKLEAIWPKQEVVFDVGPYLPVPQMAQGNALHNAVAAGQVETVSSLLAQKSDPNAVDKTGHTPLYFSIVLGFQDIFDLLVEVTTLELIYSQGETVIHVAATYGRFGMLKALLKKRPKMVDAQDDDGKTPLHTVLRNGVLTPKKKVETVRLLLAAGANPAALNNWNYSPLHWAAMGGCVGAIALLLARKVATDASNKNLALPLDEAVRMREGEAVDFLLQHTPWIPLDLYQSLRKFQILHQHRQSLLKNLDRQPFVADYLLENRHRQDALYKESYQNAIYLLIKVGESFDFTFPKDWPGLIAHSDEWLRVLPSITSIDFEQLPPLDQGAIHALLGDCLTLRAKHADAKDHYEKALEKILFVDPQHPHAARCFKGLGDVLFAFGKYETALSRYQQAWDLRRASSDFQSREIILYQLEIAKCLYALEKYQKAGLVYSEAKKKIQTEGAASFEAACVEGQADLCFANAQFEKAESYYRKSLETYQKAFSQKHPALVRSLHGIGLCLHRKGEFTLATQHFETALKLTQETLGIEHPQTASCQYGIGLCLLGQHKPAIDSFRRAINILEKGIPIGEEHPDLLVFQEAVGQCLLQKKEYGDARDTFVALVKKVEALPTMPHNIKGRALIGLGQCFLGLAQPNDAESSFTKGREELVLVLEDTHPDVVQMDVYRGDLLMQSDKYREALQFYQKAHQSFEKKLGRQHLEVGRILSRIANCYRFQKSADHAKRAYREAGNILSQRLGHAHPDVESIFRDGLKLKGSIPENDPFFAFCFNGLGEFYLHALGDKKEAKSWYQKAYDLVKAQLGENNDETQTYLANLKKTDGCSLQ